MNAEQAKALREPFPAELVGKLPKPTKRDNPKGKCRECGGWHGLPAVHLDYVGHAAVTDRLLSVDPEWHWEPIARDPATGGPILVQNQGGLGDEPLGLWGNLTVCGVTKPAFGGGKNAKECISDLIRNGAMRFGVGLDLWSKEDLHVEDQGNAGERGSAQAPEPSATPPPEAEAPSPAELHSVEWWDALTPDQILALVPRIDDPGLVRTFLAFEKGRRVRISKNARQGVGGLLERRIKELEGDEPTAETVPAEAPQAQNGAAGAAGPAPLQELLACLAFIAEQPGAVEDASFWTPTSVLVGLANAGIGTFMALDEVPESALRLVLDKVPQPVREMVVRLGPEAKERLAGQAA